MFNKIKIYFRCKSFDADRNGYVKSEAAISILLQKKESSRRIYATVRGVGCNCDGYNTEGILHPSSEGQLELLKAVYGNFDIDPNEVAYVECHGTGTNVSNRSFTTQDSCMYSIISTDIYKLFLFSFFTSVIQLPVIVTFQKIISSKSVLNIRFVSDILKISN